MKRIALALAFALVSAAASAADMPLKAPPLPAPFSWTGFYVGGNVGGVSERVSGTSNFLDPTGALIGDSSVNPQNNSFTNSSVIGGGQIGYNWQIDRRWVVGVEGDWDATNTRYSFCRQTSVTSLACTDNGDGFDTISGGTDWLATARARAGITLGSTNNVLLYGTGGAAWGRVTTTLTQNCLVGGCGSSFVPVFASSSSSTIKTGWAAGLGAEVALQGNWSVRFDWLHIDLGNVNSALATTGITPVPGTPGVASVQTATWSHSEQYDVFRVGFDYRFTH